jgi:hypothetical protein
LWEADGKEKRGQMDRKTVKYYVIHIDKGLRVPGGFRVLPMGFSQWETVAPYPR